MNFLNHVIASHTLQVTIETRETAKALKCPDTVSRLQSFLEFCSAYRHFGINVAKLASPVNEQLTKTKPFLSHLDEKERSTVHGLEEKPVKAPLLALP